MLLKFSVNLVLVLFSIVLILVNVEPSHSFAFITKQKKYASIISRRIDNEGLIAENSQHKSSHGHSRLYYSSKLGVALANQHIFENFRDIRSLQSPLRASATDSASVVTMAASKTVRPVIGVGVAGIVGLLAKRLLSVVSSRKLKLNSNNYATQFTQFDVNQIRKKLGPIDVYGRVPYDDALFTDWRLTDPNLLRQSFPEAIRNEYNNALFRFMKWGTLYDIKYSAIALAVLAFLFWSFTRAAIASRIEWDLEKKSTGVYDVPLDAFYVTHDDEYEDHIDVVNGQFGYAKAFIDKFNAFARRLGLKEE